MAAQSSPVFLVLDGDIPTSQYVGLIPMTYAAGDSTAFVIDAAGKVHQFLPGDVPLVNGASEGKKLAYYFPPDGGAPLKVNLASGAGIYAGVGLWISPADGKIHGCWLVNDGNNGAMQWHAGHIDGLPTLAPFVPGQGGSVDLGPLTQRVTTLEAQIADHWNRLNDDDKKIAALQAAVAALQSGGNPPTSTAHVELFVDGVSVYKN